MITAHLKNLGDYGSVIPCVGQIRSYLSISLNGEPGQWKNLSDTMRVILLESDSYEENVFETHQKYFDIHVTLSGCDRMEVCNVEKLNVMQAYDEVKDFALWKGSPQTTVNIYPEHFLFLSPHDGHNSKFIAAGTRKLVFKILING